MRLPVVTAAVAVAALAAGCSSGSPASSPRQTEPPTQASAQAAPKVTQFGQPATVIGAGGGQLKVTPVGVLYHRGPYTSELEGPANGWFVVVAARIEAVGKQDRPPAPIEGGGWRWRSGEQQIDTGDGNTGTTPWVGEVPEFDDPILPGQPQAGVITFDAPAKGGYLLYVGVDGAVTSWTVPDADMGTGLAKVRARIKDFS